MLLEVEIYLQFEKERKIRKQNYQTLLKLTLGHPIRKQSIKYP
jgi:hypothetical protein